MLSALIKKIPFFGNQKSAHPPPNGLFLLATHRGKKAQEVWTARKPIGFGCRENPDIDKLEVWAPWIRHKGIAYYEARIYCHRGKLLGMARMDDYSPRPSIE
jgi:hypothetical protein